MKRLMLSGLLAALICVPAWAGARHNVCFFSMDADGDGFVSMEEFHTAFPDDGDVFKAADSDGSGKLGHEEWEAYKDTQGFEDAHES